MANTLGTLAEWYRDRRGRLDLFDCTLVTMQARGRCVNHKWRGRVRA
jgi:hypothetical protein